MTDLASALAQSARLVEEALLRAREELAQLNLRKAELEAQIAQAEAIRRSQSSPAQAARALTLHEALALVLREAGNRWMSARELADAVNARGLYLRKDGQPVEVSQIHARTKNYEDLFEKEDSKIRLRADKGGKE